VAPPNNPRRRSLDYFRKNFTPGFEIAGPRFRPAWLRSPEFCGQHAGGLFEGIIVTLFYDVLSECPAVHSVLAGGRSFATVRRSLESVVSTRVVHATLTGV